MHCDICNLAIEIFYVQPAASLDLKFHCSKTHMLPACFESCRYRPGQSIHLSRVVAINVQMSLIHTRLHSWRASRESKCEV